MNSSHSIPVHCTWMILLLLLFSHLVVSYSLRPHGLQHTRPSCPSSSPRVCPSLCSLHQWCHPAISSSDALFFCPQSCPASGTFPMSRLFASDDQNTGASASASVFPVNIQGWSPLRFTGLISLWSKGLWNKRYFGIKGYFISNLLKKLIINFMHIFIEEIIKQLGKNSDK